MWSPLGSAPSSHLRLLPQSVTNGCGHCRAVGCKRRPHVFYGARAAQPAGHGPRYSPSGIEAEKKATISLVSGNRVKTIPQGLSVLDVSILSNER